MHQGQIFFGNHVQVYDQLQVINGGAVVEGDEGHVFAAALVAHPAHYSNLVVRGLHLQGLLDFYSFHGMIFFFVAYSNLSAKLQKKHNSRQKCRIFAIVMANTYTQLYTHIVFHTKSTGVVMRDEDLSRVFEFIGGIIRREGSIPFAVGGIADHIHILMTLPKTVAMSDFVRVIKAKSSKWLKTVDEYYEPFQWQEGYGAFSVSPSMMARTTKYIFGQAEHHKTKTYHDEYCETLKAYGIEYDERYAFGD